MAKIKKKKEGSDQKMTESKKNSSEIKEEKVSALGRYMKKVRAEETARDDKPGEKTSFRSK